MEITREQKGELKEVIKINIEKEDYEQKVNDTLKDYRKKAKMDGFRPGKVPFGLVKKMYGKAVTLDEINKLISEKLGSYLKEEQLDILGEPIPDHESQEQIDVENQDNFTFYFKVGLSPQIDPEKLSEVTVPYYALKPDEESIEITIESHLNSHGERIEVEQADDKDIVQGDLIELDDEGNPKEDGLQNKQALISIELIKDDTIKDQFVGAQKEDIIDFNLRTALPNDTELASLLNKQKEDIQDNNSDFRLTIDNIKRFKKAELNQELYDTIYGEGEVSSEEEYRKKVEESLKDNFKRESNYKFMSDVREKLLEYYNPDLPDDVLKHWLVEKDENLTQDNIEEEYPKIRENLQWEVISSKLSQHFEIKVSEDDLKDFAAEYIKMQFQQYGMDLSMMPEDFAEQYAEEILQKDQERQRIENAKKEEKLANTLQDHVTLDTKEVTYDEYKEIVQPGEDQNAEQEEDSNQQSDENEETSETESKQEDQ